MGRYDVDLLDGFDGRQIIYDEKKEKKYHARIWWFLLGVVVFVLLRGVIFHIEEVRMKKCFQVIEATYYENTAQAVYVEENGLYHQYDISGFAAEHEGDTIKLYYENQIAYAKPVREAGFWTRTYLTFGLAGIFITWRLWMIYKKQDLGGTV